jgi:hypothetical protein
MGADMPAMICHPLAVFIQVWVILWVDGSP